MTWLVFIGHLSLLPLTCFTCDYVKQNPEKPSGHDVFDDKNPGEFYRLVVGAVHC